MDNHLHIITLSGAEETGKTSSLRELIKILPKHGFNLVAGSIQNLEKRYGGPKDQSAIFTYNSKKIGIWTSGDAGFVVQESINFAVRNELDILVNASRLRLGTRGIIEKYDQSATILSTFSHSDLNKKIAAKLATQNASILLKLLK